MSAPNLFFYTFISKISLKNEININFKTVSSPKMSSKDGSQISKETGSSKDGSKKGGSSTSSSMAEVRSGGDTGEIPGRGVGRLLLFQFAR